MPVTFNAIKPGLGLADQVASAIEHEIRAGQLAEGARLPTEQMLAQQFGVSRTVVREAVSRLKSAGLIDTRQGSGTYVRKPGVQPLRFDPAISATLEAVLQIVETRRALECEAAELAAERGSKEDVRRIRTALRAIQRAVESGQDGVEEDVRFHRAIAQAARNPFLKLTLDYLSQFLSSATRVTRANEARSRKLGMEVLREHEALVDAIEAGDSSAARAAAARHLRNAARRIENAPPEFWLDEGRRLAQALSGAGARPDLPVPRA